MADLPPEHGLRRALTHEMHARPFASFKAPQRATHLAMLSDEGAAEEDRRHVADLCARLGAAGPAEGETHCMVDLGSVRLKWERHAEFSTYTFFETPADETFAIFAAPGFDALPSGWLAGLPGELLVGTRLALAPAATAPFDLAALTRLFGSDNLAGSTVASGAASVFLDFRIHEDGFGRILVHDRHLLPRQAGRLVQRLLEIETYRTVALLALPIARQYGASLGRAATRLTDIMTAIRGGLSDERRLLSELTDLSAEIEGMAAAADFRFGAARAYYALVRHRVDELREERVSGLQTLAQFLDRRLAPAMRTCEAIAERLERLSRHIGGTGDLLRTRVDIQLEAQNTDLLRSMNRRARLQLRLQQTVEGLSVAAISYYLVGLVSYAAKAAKSAGLSVNAELVAGIAIVPVVAAVAFGVRRLRTHLRVESGARERNPDADGA
ncbi:MAG: DUF3422 family protein [Kiloniellaceae bacterium]